MRFLVTGTPRSATKYTARLLTALGIPCGHENILRPVAQIVDVWRWGCGGDCGESSWMAWTVLPLIRQPVPAIHVVRNPWAVIDSLTNRNSIVKTEQFRSDTMLSIRDTITAYLPGVLGHKERVNRAAAFVVGWNRLIAERVPTRCVFRADIGGPLEVQKAVSHIGGDASLPQIVQALEETPTTINAGFTVNDTTGISDPLVARWIQQYAEQQDAQVFCREIVDVPDRETPEELASRMAPDLLEQVNEHAKRYGYPTQQPACVAA